MTAKPAIPRPTARTEWFPLGLLACAWGLALWYGPALPDPVPTHWGIDGRPNGWMPKPWGMYIGPSIFTLAYLFMTAVPYLDPRRAHWANSFRVYPVIKTSLAAFFLLLEALSLRAALHPGHVLKPEGIAIGMGLLFVVLGNYLPKVRSNFFLGIRTPWTLASDRVWEQTHRLAGWTFVVSGASMVLAALVAPGCTLAIVIGAAGLAALVPAGWSWWLYQRTERTSEQNRLE